MTWVKWLLNECSDYLYFVASFQLGGLTISFTRGRHHLAGKKGIHTNNPGEDCERTDTHIFWQSWQNLTDLTGSRFFPIWDRFSFSTCLLVSLFRSRVYEFVELGGKSVRATRFSCESRVVSRENEKRVRESGRQRRERTTSRKMLHEDCREIGSRGILTGKVSEKQPPLLSSSSCRNLFSLASNVLTDTRGKRDK